ncbi:hypothetical protein PX52LOC_07465 [Limnoglobus roseus]|uniref:Secreted protein n=1 Tax=Limnoglobus roseus TaxID=2598579 RepID=A0A5C1ARP1_9BACT|nr:hypothetical protein PX52LOC_07465 [Limnoglobus roseus]
MLLVRVLLLVACGPLLVPAGFCVCHADEPHPVGESQLPDSHDDHQPDCPASAQVDAYQPSLSVQSSLIDPGLTPESLVFATLDVLKVVRPRLVPSDCHVPSPPLYVSHCALVI